MACAGSCHSSQGFSWSSWPISCAYHTHLHLCIYICTYNALTMQLAARVVLPMDACGAHRPMAWQALLWHLQRHGRRRRMVPYILCPLQAWLLLRPVCTSTAAIARCARGFHTLYVHRMGAYIRGCLAGVHISSVLLFKWRHRLKLCIRAVVQLRFHAHGQKVGHL